jgi:hypothetical protein
MNEHAGKTFARLHGLPPRAKSPKIVDKTNGPAGKHQSQKNEPEERPVNDQRNFATNHDEQKKIINADQSQALEETEKEGD